MQSAGGMKAAPYHGGMKSKERIRAQNAWRSGDIQVMRWAPRCLPPTLPQALPCTLSLDIDPHPNRNFQPAVRPCVCRHHGRPVRARAAVSCEAELQYDSGERCRDRFEHLLIMLLSSVEVLAQMRRELLFLTGDRGDDRVWHGHRRA